MSECYKYLLFHNLKAFLKFKKLSVCVFLGKNTSGFYLVLHPSHLSGLEKQVFLKFSFWRKNVHHLIPAIAFSPVGSIAEEGSTA